MEYQEFFSRFGGSLRTKHLAALSQPGNREANIEKPRDHVEKRHFELPDSSELPKEFIRLDPWEAEYLFLIASYAKQGIVETGRYNGGSAFLMACSNPHVPIHSIDLEPQDDDKLRSLIAETRIGSNIDLIVGDSQKKRYPQIEAFDVLFIDGDHSYQGCLNDLENWFHLLSEGGHLILHDSYEGNEVQPAALTFIGKNSVEVIVSPNIVAQHWMNPRGSLAHFLKTVA